MPTLGFKWVPAGGGRLPPSIIDSIAICPILAERFDDDPSIADKSSSHLPVQSAKCAHRICYSCILRMKMEKAVRLNKDPCGIKWLACPMCRAKTSFNSEDPVVDLGRCEALKLFRGKGMTMKRLDEQEMAGAAGAALRLIRAADITIASQAATIASQAATIASQAAELKEIESKGKIIAAVGRIGKLQQQKEEGEKRRNAKRGQGGRRKRSFAHKGNLRAKGERDKRGIVKTFQARLQELRAYKTKHGHVNVKTREDKSLATFCAGIRSARKHPESSGRRKLTEEDIASLDALGFDWQPLPSRATFQERVKQLKAYKAKHGHIDVKKSEDNSLYLFCTGIRRARRRPGYDRGHKLTEERISSLDALQFDWEPQRSEKVKSFEERLDALTEYKARHGHIDMNDDKDSSLYQLCCHVRFARRNPESRLIELTEERIASLDALGFDWTPTKGRA